MTSCNEQSILSPTRNKGSGPEKNSFVFDHVSSIKEDKTSNTPTPTNFPIYPIYFSSVFASEVAGASVISDGFLGSDGGSVSASEEVHRVRLSRRSCMISVESL